MRNAIAVCVMMSTAINFIGDAANAADTPRGDAMLAAYFSAETNEIAAASLADFSSWIDWNVRRDEFRRHLREMLGLEPMLERAPLDAVVTGKLERDAFRVEKVHFQSRPHLYVTGNLYLPKKAAGRGPAILYVCGHSNVKKNGISYGSKVAYQKYGAWFARNGYVCLVIDTLQLGEIEGLHHGTYREGMWWWNARGYTPAGVETWNAIRAIDYLASRPEVDAERIGMTGRSGGGAYTWFVTALDDRVKAAVPAAGITTLKNHVVNGCVARHCDCMFFVNKYRWDFTRVAALAAPRPLLILNTRQDPLFPLDGVNEIFQALRQIYGLHGNAGDVQLTLADGTHEDSRELQLAAMQWFDKYLMGKSRRIDGLPQDFFQAEELKVLDRLPADEINTRIQEAFVPMAVPPSVPDSQATWVKARNEWMTELREQCFSSWPQDAEPSHVVSAKSVWDAAAGDVRFRAYDFVSQANIQLKLYVLTPSGMPDKEVTAVSLRVMSADDWQEFLSSLQIDFVALLNDESLPAPNSKNFGKLGQELGAGRAIAFVAPRGIGPTAWSGDAKQQTHTRRRFMLLGQTLDGMRIWDVRRAVQALRSISGFEKTRLTLIGDREMSGVALYASLFEPNIDAVSVQNLPASHRRGPDLLNVLRFLDMPQIVAMVAEHSDVKLEQVVRGDAVAEWEYPLAVAKKLGWTRRIEIHELAVGNSAAPKKKL